MGRRRGKAKKQTVAPCEDTGSGEEEKVPTFRRRGRPLKPPLKDNIEEDEIEKTEEDGLDAKVSITGKDMKNHAATENGRKRKRSKQTKEEIELVKEESVLAPKTIAANDSTKTAGFRQIGSRRKNKPRRAAEAGVECK